MNTEQIMDLADEYANAENQDYLSGEGKADFYKTALQTAIEALVQERDALDAEATRLSDHATELRTRRDKLAAENNVLRDALGAMLTHMGMDEDEWNKPTFDQARKALTRSKS